jgi:ubiquitin C-terminal hydrolase
MFGLVNGDNTCYFNAVTQSLINFCKFFDLYSRTHIIDRDLRNNLIKLVKNSSNVNEKIKQKAIMKGTSSLNREEFEHILQPILSIHIHTLINTIVMNATSENGNMINVIDIHVFKKFFKRNFTDFEGTMHQDSHEALISLLSKLSEETEFSFKYYIDQMDAQDNDLMQNPESDLILGTRIKDFLDFTRKGFTNANTEKFYEKIKNGWSPIKSLFAIFFELGIRCEECQTIYRSVHDEICWSVSIPKDSKQKQWSYWQAQESIYLINCIENDLKYEIFSKDNKYACIKCKTDTVATKASRIFSAPPCLLIHLKRIEQMSGGNYTRLEKDTRTVIYDEILDLTPFSTVPVKYKLNSVICHKGTTNHGHYYTIFLKNGIWYCADDDKITQLNNYFDANAYILAYELIE